MVLMVQHGFQGPAGEGSDYYINTFHFESPGAADIVAFLNTPATPGGTDSPGHFITTHIHAFYIGHAGTAADNPIFYYSNMIGNPGWFVKVYDLDLAGTGAPPVYQEFTAVAPSGMADSPSLPPEVALVLSLEAFPPGVTNRARRRNRIYLGPFNVQAIDTGSAHDISQPDIDLVNAILREYEQLVDDLATEGLSLGVYSKTDEVITPTTRAWVDRAWDTQRRRGSDSTGRLFVDL